LAGRVHYHVNLLHGDPSSPASIFVDYVWRSINVRPSWVASVVLLHCMHRQICLFMFTEKIKWFGL